MSKVSDENKFNIFLFSGSLKIVCVYVLRVLVRFFWIFPVKENRVFFHSYLGKSYNCNPKYISEKLLEKYGTRVEIIWAFNNPNRYKYLEQMGYKVVKRTSFKGVYYAVTAKISISNSGSYSWLPLRKKQHHINTWHGGGCYKCIGNKDKQMKKGALKSNYLTQKETTEFISSCRKFSEHEIRGAFNYSGKILEIGMPRNDIIFQEKQEKLKEKIVKKYGGDLDDYLVLIAPTYRNEDVGKDFVDVLFPDLNQLSLVIQRKYNRHAKFLFRSHYFSGKINLNGIDVSDYDDMQELLVAVDMVITDYSSLIWDFSFTKKPCLLYVPDLEEYREKKGLFNDIYSWGFPVCMSDEELEKAIINFNQREYESLMDKHHQDFGSFEKGDASQYMSEYIGNIMGIN